MKLGCTVEKVSNAKGSHYLICDRFSFSQMKKLEFASLY